MYRIAVFASHPVQYKAPLYRTISNSDDIDITVFYGAKHGTTPTDLGFDEEQMWKIPLLDGYDYEFLPNYSLVNKPDGFLSLINPHLISELGNSYDALLIHTGYYRFSSLLSILASRIHDIPVLLHGTGHPHAVPLHTALVKQIYVRTFLSGVDVVLADCTANKWYYEGFGFPTRDIYLMPTAVDNDRFRKARKELTDSDLEALRSELDIPVSHSVVLFVGKLVERKRPRDLLEAFARLPDNIEASLVFIGDGEEREELETYREKESLNNVVFAGFRDQQEIPTFYELGDLFVLPSSYDPSPKVLNEAMNFELPLITTDGVGSALDLVKDNGCFYPVGDIEALREALIEFLTTPTELKRMGGRSYEIVEDWNYETAVEVFREVLAGAVNDESKSVNF